MNNEFDDDNAGIRMPSSILMMGGMMQSMIVVGAVMVVEEGLSRWHWGLIIYSPLSFIKKCQH